MYCSKKVFPSAIITPKMMHSDWSNLVMQTSWLQMFILCKGTSLATPGPEISLQCCLIFFHFFSGVTRSRGSNPLKRELSPVAALFVWLLITGLLNMFVSFKVCYTFSQWVTLSKSSNYYFLVSLHVWNLFPVFSLRNKAVLHLP